MIDNLYVVYENNGKYFPTYDLAWKNRWNGSSKQVNYVYTPTWQSFKRVGDLERCHRTFMRKTFDCDYLDLQNHYCYKQLSLI